MPKPQPRLGRGLSSIIPPTTSPVAHSLPAIPPAPVLPAASPTAPIADGRIHPIHLADILPNPAQPRQRFDEARIEQLADSIRTSGLVQPVLVRPRDDGRFELVAGERRWRAAQRAGCTTIPAIVRDLSDAAALELALVENLQREDLDPLERAVGYHRYLTTFGMTAEQLAARLGESRANIVNYIRLLDLPEEIRALIADGSLSMGQARAIAGIPDPHRQLAVARLAVRKGLSTRQVEQLARRSEIETETEPVESAQQLRGRASHPTHYAELERQLSKAVGLRVEIRPGRRKNAGRVILRYNSLEEFDRIFARLGGTPSGE